MTRPIIAAALPAAVCTLPASTSTPRATRSGPDFGARTGASFRQDASRTIDTPGRSGDPTKLRYRDLARLPAAAAAMPLPSSRAVVEIGTAEMLKRAP